jgi:diguanylate cyclase (GGDEF)-like protein
MTVHCLYRLLSWGVAASLVLGLGSSELVLRGTVSTSRLQPLVLGLVVPLGLLVVVTLAYTSQGPETVHVGGFAAVPLFAAIFGGVRTTSAVVVLSWIVAMAYANSTGQGFSPETWTRLAAVALFGGVAVVAAYFRVKREGALVLAEHTAMQAAQFREMAENDLLTGILNRRGVVHAIAERDPSTPRTLALLDIDNLKVINDSFGHVVGDEYLSAVGRRLAGSIASTDIVGRWGGDEFLIVLELPFDHSEPVLGRAHAAVVSRPVTTSGKVVDVSVSLGITSWSPGQSLDDALNKADAALYEAKQAGRNQLIFGR